jgi:hypothetical protein
LAVTSIVSAVVIGALELLGNFVSEVFWIPALALALVVTYLQIAVRQAPPSR